MWDYSEKVKQHFFEPRNVGVLDDADAVGEVGSISCGDALKLFLKIENEHIVDARFQTFGCGSAIASSSALTEMVIGKSLDDALRLTNQDIADYLDGLPPEKMHCSVMGAEALRAAIASFRGEAQDEDDHEDGALICNCFGIHKGMIERAVRVNRLSSVEAVTNFTKAGGACKTCHDKIEDVLAEVLAEMALEEGKAAPLPTARPAPSVRPAPAPVAASVSVPAPAPMTTLKKIQLISAAIDEMRPSLQRDGGDIELVDVDGDTVLVDLRGACVGCQMSSATLSGVQERLAAVLGRVVRVLPARAA